jgi:iron-sulfur cluster protein
MSAIPPFAVRLEEGLESKTIPVALGRAMGLFRQRREAAFQGEDFAEIQKRLYALKAEAIERLPELVERFKLEAEAVGTRVHQARDAAEACAVVARICREAPCEDGTTGARLVVKSKSMVSEEIHLNEHLERLGIKVVETDLGEWILQLAHERPSHLIAPAVHKTREQIAELFSEETGEPVSKEIAELVRVARASLRQAFISADVGVSGANIGIAETGTLCIVTNEGNGRLVTTLPPVHVAIMGVEKIVPSLDEAAELLKVLARNATGQKQTSYVSFITGPSRSADIELSLAIGVHGPREQHVILLDNGRWAARDDPDFREALHCIKCGACSNVCPPYLEVGGHAFGYVYTGPIGLVLTAIHDGLGPAGGPQSLCASCNTCQTVCPVGIPIPRQIIDVRQRYVAKNGLPLAKRLARDALTNERLQRWARALQPLVVSEGRLIRNMPFAAGLTSWRSLPALAPKPLRRLIEDGLPSAPRTIEGSPAKGLRVAYFPGCMTDRLYPEMGEAAMRVLAACGCQISMPTSWLCCGLVSANAGDKSCAVELAKGTLLDLERTEADFIVSTSTSCAVMLVQDYPHLLRDEPEWLTRASKVAEKVIDFTSFMHKIARLPSGTLADGEPAAVTYHDPCQSSNCLGLRAEARRIITDVLGLELHEMAESTTCCGFGGTFSLEHPRVAKRLLKKKLDHAFETGASVLVADNPGCLMHLRGGVDKTGRPLRVLHLTELIAERL